MRPGEVSTGKSSPVISIRSSVSTRQSAGTVPTYVNGVPTGATASYDNFAAAQRAAYVGRSYDYSRDFLTDAKINGVLFPGLYQGGIAFNLGGEYRESRTEGRA